MGARWPLVIMVGPLSKVWGPTVGCLRYMPLLSGGFSLIPILTVVMGVLLQIPLLTLSYCKVPYRMEDEGGNTLGRWGVRTRRRQ